ncbi:MAG: GTP-binding protein TypA [Candidatus Magasanikbacteria bacterium RIFOXYD2_FULL_36_9]|uniref:50S ribosomal subunit assembly factor BipA n=1 Tax=Candidatus Magasanikbacteria bacterium RIFOXYD2_FULL_36_9 TaxID=1798707 RepID=A0A1F6P299_9BACT|nr:MAG: GTP-binding protein TypA [Candidatus Magasanikbacteria bacterium RIFOXYD2_FULL_36_9]
MQKIRNIAIIAHVDHGKTTLVDALLHQAKTKFSKDTVDQICVMDSNDLEKERGITIFSKNASVRWGDHKVNIIDTPGHADFGGEVERVLTMADGCLLLVDAKEGPMPQTRFVLKKALEMKLKVIVVVNKIDKPDARPAFALDKTFDLFLELGADDETANFPVIYASAKQGLAGLEPDLSKMTDVGPLFDTVLSYIPEPSGDAEKPLQMLITTLSADNYKGRIATGKLLNGRMKANQEVARIRRDGTISKHRIVALMTFEGLDRCVTEDAEAGDIVAIAGIGDCMIGETVADPINPIALPVLKIEEPTVKMTFMVNDSPFAGKEGQFTTSRQINERLYKELETDMALRVENGQNNDWIVSGRGELHLAILIERLRREGYEIQVSRPQVIIKEIDGKKMVPFETIYIEAPEFASGSVIQKLGSRHGLMQHMNIENGIFFAEFLIPTRGLFGYRTEFLTDTKGMGIVNTIFNGYYEDPGNWNERDQGSLVAHETGITNLYGLLNSQDRGQLFLGPAVEVYAGQVVGQHARTGDLRVNVCKTKALSNMRSKGDGVSEHFNAPKTMDLEDALEYIGDDELVEITPKNIRLRKQVLSESEARKKMMGIK